MSSSTGGVVLEVTKGVRLRMAREYGGYDRGEFAAVIGVNRESVTRWETDKTEPRPYVLGAWALATGVSRWWLETGTAPTVNGEGQSLPELDSNQQPAGFKPGTDRSARREWLAPVIVLRPSVGQPAPARPAASA